MAARHALVAALVAVLAMRRVTLAFTVLTAGLNNNVPPESPPPFRHWDLRQFAGCEVPYAINQDGTADVAGEHASIDKGFQSWQNVTPAIIRFKNVGNTTTAKIDATDNENVLFWDDDICNGDAWDVALLGGAVAAAFIHHDALTGVIRDVDIVFDDEHFEWTDGMQKARLPPIGDDETDNNDQIIEKPMAPRNGVCDTAAVCDDDQLIDVLDPAGAGAACVGPGVDGVLDSMPNLGGKFDVQVVATHEIGHFCGLGENVSTAVPQEATEGAEVLETLNDEPFTFAAGATLQMTIGGVAVTVNFPAGARTAAQVAADINAAIAAGAAAGTATATATAGSVRIEADDEDDEIIVTGGTALGVLGALLNESGISTMNQPDPRGNTELDQRTLSRDDWDGLNFLYSPDLGDAPDPFGGAAFNRYPSKVHGSTNLKMLNGVQLFVPAAGAEHLFGLFGKTGTPRYQYEWLGTTSGRIDDSDVECEARVPDRDEFDDGVTFADPFTPGGAAVAVTVHVSTAKDIKGNMHAYGAAQPLFINGWFDWNADGDWDDAGEHAIGGAGGAAVSLVPAAVPSRTEKAFMVSAPAGAKPGGYARFRLDHEENAGQATHVDATLDPAAMPPGGLTRGAAQLGEVEDHLIRYCMVDCRTKGRLGSGAQIACNLVANDAGGSFQLGKNAFMSDGTSISGDAVKLGQDTSVWSAFYNTIITGDGAAIRDGTGAPTLPLLDPFPSVLAAACTGPDVVVQRLETVTLAPGSYNRVRVLRGGTLVLAPGGIFNACSLRTTRGGAVFAAGTDQTTVNVAETLRIANASVLQPVAGAPPPIVNVAGLLVRVGRDAQVDAFVTAPEATFRIGRGGHVNGSFVMKECGTDKEVVCGCTIAGPPAEPTTTSTSMPSTTTTVP